MAAPPSLLTPAVNTLDLRPACGPFGIQPLAQPERVGSIFFYHPLAATVPMFCLSANDSGGLQFGVMEDAFRVVADNQHGEIFRVDVDARAGTLTRTHSVHLNRDELVPPGSYTYLTGPSGTSGTMEEWAVVLRFEDWTCPQRSEIHEDWQLEDLAADTTLYAPAVDQRRLCIVSGMEDAVDAAPPLPKMDIGARRWHVRNTIAADALGVPNEAASSNKVDLTKTVHHLFDQGHFVLSPKSSALHTHFLQQDARQSVQLWHNRATHPLPVGSHGAVYLRFAWAILKLMKGFHRAIAIEAPPRLRYTIYDPKTTPSRVDRLAMTFPPPRPPSSAGSLERSRTSSIAGGESLALGVTEVEQFIEMVEDAFAEDLQDEGLRATRARDKVKVEQLSAEDRWERSSPGSRDVFERHYDNVHWETASAEQRTRVAEFKDLFKGSSKDVSMSTR